MPKLFPIHIEVEELAVGKVMRLLNKMPGIAKLNLDLERETKPNGHREPHPRKPFKKFEVKAEEFVSGLLFKDPMPTKVLKDHFADVGRSPLSVNSQMTEMKDNGIVKLVDGNWVLTKKGRDRIRTKLPKGKK